jgi:hypothetical protein
MRTRMYPCPMRDETATKSLCARISNDSIVSSPPACLSGREWSILASWGAQGPCSSPDVISVELCRVDASDCTESHCMSMLAERPLQSPAGIEAALFRSSSSTFPVNLIVVVAVQHTSRCVSCTISYEEKKKVFFHGGLKVI